MHYNSVEKTISLYFIITGAIISANSFFIADLQEFSLFKFSEFQIACCFFIFVVGTIFLLKVIEHRLLIITYVKNLNQNRKWFDEVVSNNTLKGYSLFHTSFTSPKYYKKFRHFYWEVMGLGTVNSVFFALFLINLFKKLNFNSNHSHIINWAWLIGVSLVGIIVSLQYYRHRGNTEEEKLHKRSHLIK